MTLTELVLAVMIIQIAAALGNLGYNWYQRRYNRSSLHCLFICIAWFCGLCVYGLIGLLGWGFGIVSKTEFYFFVIFYGAHIGPIQSFSRAIMCPLTPTAHESEIFALYEITDKGSSWIGPIVVGIINQVASMRYGLLYCLFTFLVTLPVVVNLDIEAGKIAAGRDAESITDRYNLRK